MSETLAARPPRHLWIIGGLALVWSLLGALDFSLLVTRNAWYLSHFTPEQIEHGNSYPDWLVAAWTIAVCCGVIGTLLILMRKKLAVSVLLVSFLFWMLWAAKLDVAGDISLAVPLLPVLVSIVYARFMTRAGVLI